MARSELARFAQSTPSPHKRKKNLIKFTPTQLMLPAQSLPLHQGHENRLDHQSQTSGADGQSRTTLIAALKKKLLSLPF